MTAPVPAHGDPQNPTTAPVPEGHVDAAAYERIRAEQRAAALAGTADPAAAAPADYEDRPQIGPGQAREGEWLDDATAEVKAEQAPKLHDGPPPGWYVDPADKMTERWWDGSGYPGPSRPSPAAAQAELEKAGAPLTADEKREREEQAAAAAREARAIELGATAVPLEGTDGRTDVVYVLDPNDWPSWANSRLHVGDFESWAEKCLAPGYYEAVWLALDPTNRQVNALFTAYREATGQDAGKSRPSASTLRRSGRR